MSLESGIDALATRIAQEFNTVRGEIPSGGGSASFMQLTNTDILTELNTATATTIPLGGTALTEGSDFTQNGNAIQCDFNGKIKITANVYMVTATIQRAALAMQAYREGIALSPMFNTSYIRRASGHNEASCACPSFIATCSNGDEIDLRGIRQGATGTGLTMALIGASYMLVERIS